ncbi:hypothetical protein [Sphingomonas sp.]|uniref:hypothetical protein n=1 Tax=Sphingomonas sp. TaxID=28214 RepID=UPI0025DE9244|nr:hypothetical protein [Sphingomonas sp.]
MKKPASLSPFRAALMADPILFTPVPVVRPTARGWSADVQVAFIAALSRCGIVTAAARSVGRTARSAYVLRAHRDGGEFSRAWDAALKLGQDDAHFAIIRECFEPQQVPIIRRGVVIGTRAMLNEKLAMAAVRNRFDNKARIKRMPPHEIWDSQTPAVPREKQPEVEVKAKPKPKSKPAVIPKRPLIGPRIRLL